MTENVCFIDTETLGLDADHHAVWEVGLILPSGSECIWHVQVTDREKSLAHPIALEIGRFEERYGQTNGKPISRAELAAKLWQHIPPGAHLAGAVVSFDEERLRRLMWAEGLSPRWHYHLIDVEALAIGYLAGIASAGGKGYLAGTPHPPWKSDELTAALGITVPEESKHTALGDARWAKAIYETVIRGCRGTDRS